MYLTIRLSAHSTYFPLSGPNNGTSDDLFLTNYVVIYKFLFVLYCTVSFLDHWLQMMLELLEIVRVFAIIIG